MKLVIALAGAASEVRMGVLFGVIGSFVDDELIPALRWFASEHAAGLHAPMPVTIDIDSSAKLSCRVYVETAAYRIALSRGWLFRLPLVFQLIDQMWATRDGRSKLWALNINTAFDRFFFAEASDAHSNFMVANDLSIPFLDHEDEGEQWRLLGDFQDRFNDKRNGMAILDFRLPDELSTKVKRDCLTAFMYLILHEFFHVARDHAAFNRQARLMALEETGSDGSYLSLQQAASSTYLRKALEVDADAFALYFMVGHFIGQSGNPLVEDLSGIFSPIFTLLSMLDIGRRTLEDYQTSVSSHPAPDIRVFCSWQALKERARKLGDDLDEQIDAAMKRSIAYCAASFQQLGMPNGAFYLLENRRLTIDDQLIHEISLMVLLQEEITGVETMYRWIMQVRESEIPAVNWIYIPVSYSKDEFTKACVTEAKRILTQATKGGQPEIDPQDQLARQMIKARERLGWTDRDMLLFLHDPSTASPYLGENGKALRGPDPKVRIQAVQGKAFQQLLKYAGATMTVKPGNHEQ